MRRTSWTYGILAATLLATATPGAAQTVRIGPDGIRIVPQESTRDRGENRDRRGERYRVREGVSERDAVRIARRQGLREVRQVTRTRNAYRVAGVDRRGDRIRVDVDRDSGAVIRVR